MKQERYKPSQVAKILGVNIWTIRRWMYAGKVPYTKDPDTGRNYIPAWWVEQQLGTPPTSQPLRCALYARESSSDKKAALQSQTDGLTQYAQARGYQIVHIVTEFGSGLTDNRPKLHKLLSQRDFDILLVEHKERLTRFGFRWFETLCPFQIEVMNLAENGVNDLMEDLVAIVSSFAARLYGHRRGRKKTQAALKILQEPNGDQKT